jgi:hypothetical protein
MVAVGKGLGAYVRRLPDRTSQTKFHEQSKAKTIDIGVRLFRDLHELVIPPRLIETFVARACSRIGSKHSRP